MLKSIFSAALIGLCSQTALAQNWLYAEPKSCDFTLLDLDNNELKGHLEVTRVNPESDVIVDFTVSRGESVLSHTRLDKVNPFWDGHSAGLLTAPGFSLSYTNWYGVIHFPELTINTVLDSSNPGWIKRWKDGICIGSQGVPPAI